MAERTKSKSEVEASLEPALREAFNQLYTDYVEATKLHTRYKGAPSAKILAELIERGWRRSANPAG